MCQKITDEIQKKNSDKRGEINHADLMGKSPDKHQNWFRNFEKNFTNPAQRMAPPLGKPGQKHTGNNRKTQNIQNLTDEDNNKMQKTHARILSVFLLFAKHPCSHNTRHQKPQNCRPSISHSTRSSTKKWIDRRIRRSTHSR